MKPILPLFVAVALLSGSGLQAQDGPPEQDVTVAGLPDVELTPRLLYQFLLAEIASQRGQFANSAELYLDLARRTRDPRLARRATEIAVHARHPQLAQQAAELMLDIDPASLQAHLTLINVLVAQGRYAELQPRTAALLALAPQQIGTGLLRLNSLFARAEDKQAVRELIEALTAPYLQLPEAHYVRAVAAFDARDPDAARDAARQARKLKPDW
ncbi:MAG: hypothetical protein Q8J72_09350 [Rhodocyclaceae bacterium]|nr:hypothetical protein [Rhodocyclaceae bacterium]